MSTIWYIATLVLKCEVAGEPIDPEWTCIEQVHTIRADNRDMAYEKAIAIGKSEEIIYKNSFDQDVIWSFVGLENLEELLSKTIRDGTEVWGRAFTTHSPDALVVDKDHLSVYYIDQIGGLTAEEIIEGGFETTLMIDRVER